MDFPRRTQSAPAVGQRLEIAPTELQEYLAQQHGITQLITGAPSWDHFCWSGSELSSPLRALYAAEGRGLLTQIGGRAVDIQMSDVQADINGWLENQGRKAVTLGSVESALVKASKYVHCALGLNLIVNRKQKTMRINDAYDTAANISKWSENNRTRINGVIKELQHAQSCGFDVSHALEPMKNASEGFALMAAATKEPAA